VLIAFLISIYVSVSTQKIFTFPSAERERKLSFDKEEDVQWRSGRRYEEKSIQSLSLRRPQQVSYNERDQCSVLPETHATIAISMGGMTSLSSSAVLLFWNVTIVLLYTLYFNASLSTLDCRTARKTIIKSRFHSLLKFPAVHMSHSACLSTYLYVANVSDSVSFLKRQ
jgi:hypothetical protein